MKILFDHQLFYDVYGGASKYFAMMINALPRDCWDTTTLLSCNEYVRAKGLFRTVRKRFRGQASLLEHINRPYTKHVLKKQQFDVFHQTNFGLYFGNSLGTKPLVVTYHDANMSTYNPHPDIVKLQRESLMRADAVIAVSNNTKNDLLKFFDIDPKKVHVVYHGIEKPTLATTSVRVFDFPYVLYVGFRAEYKNFRRFVEAYALYHKQFPEVRLVCTSYPFNAAETEFFRRLGIAADVINVPADEEKMVRLYRDAEFFVYPSLYEGFGMPILEAWVNGCPVVLSNASCFPEIAADAGLFFDPNDVDDMASKMEKITSDSNLKEELIAKGKSRVENFTWQKSAQEHMAVYKSLA